MLTTWKRNCQRNIQKTIPWYSCVMTLASKSHTATQETHLVSSCVFKQCSSKEHQIATGRYSSGALTEICVNYVAGTYNFPPCLCESTLGSTLPTPRSTPAWFCTSCCHFDVVSVFFVVVAIGLLRRFLYDPLALVLCRTLVTRITFLCMVVSKTWFTHMLWFELNPWFEQKSCFCVKTVFYKKRRFTQKPCLIHKHHVLHKNHVLGLCKRCGQDSSFHGGGNRRRR